MADFPLRSLLEALPIPMVVAPMTAISTPALVAAARAGGVVGAFPTSNCASIDELERWLDEIDSSARRDAARGVVPGPVCANLIVARSNKRLDEDVACVVRRRIPLVITSVGSPAPVVAPLHAAGCLVLADVASVAHAKKALAAGADGLVLLSAGAGGHTGWANPFAFTRAVRAFYDGPLVVTGGMADGEALWAAIALGCDAGMFGTRFIACPESGASPGWRSAILESSMDDIVLSKAPNGLAASLMASGGGSAGHTAGSVTESLPAPRVLDEIQREWTNARSRTREQLDLGRMSTDFTSPQGETA